jgi:hypothetical protein
MADKVELTTAQKVARPVINFLVERFFPNGAFFYGDGPLSHFDKLDSERKSPIGSMAAMSLVRKAHEANASRMSVDIGGMTLNDTDLGDWRVTVERITPLSLPLIGGRE